MSKVLFSSEPSSRRGPSGRRAGGELLPGAGGYAEGCGLRHRQDARPRDHPAPVHRGRQLGFPPLTRLTQHDHPIQFLVKRMTGSCQVLRRHPQLSLLSRFRFLTP